MRAFLREVLILGFVILSLTGCFGTQTGHKPVAAVNTEAGTVSLNGTVTYNKQIKSLFTLRCAKCHTGSPYPDWSNYDVAFEKRASILDRVVGHKDMPKDNITGMTDDERKLVAKWIDAGAPRSDEVAKSPTDTSVPSVTPIPTVLPTPVAECKPALSGALFKAVSAGQGADVESLLIQGACPNIADAAGRSPIIAAILDNSSGNESYSRVVKALLAAGADSRAVFNGATPLIWASYNDDVGSAMTLLEGGADPNVIVTKDSDHTLESTIGFTPLMFAVQSIEPDLVNALLVAGASINTATAKGATAISLANELNDAVKKPVIVQLLNGFAEGGLMAVPSFMKDIKPIFQDRCAKCHNEVSPQMNWLDYSVAYKKRALIYVRAIGIKDMPADNNVTNITEDERAKLGQWIKTGASK